MAVRPQFAIVDKSSTNLVTAGNALSAEFATQAFPESHNKRQFVNLYPVNTAVNNGFTTGNTPAELSIDGVQNFRFRLADRSTCIIRYIGCYNSSNAANSAAFSGEIAVQNNGGTLTILGTPVNTKYPPAVAAVLAFTVDNPTQSLVVTCTGVAGDTNGRWNVCFHDISEVTDLG